MPLATDSAPTAVAHVLGQTIRDEHSSPKVNTFITPLVTLLAPPVPESVVMDPLSLSI